MFKQAGNSSPVSIYHKKNEEQMNNISNQAQCNKCRRKLGDYDKYFLHTMQNRDSTRIGDTLLCEECATELLQDAQSAREEDE